MRSLSLVTIAVVALALPTAAFPFADTMVSLRALPLEMDASDGAFVTIVEVSFLYRKDGFSLEPTEVALSIAEQPVGIEAALVPDRVSFPITVDVGTGSSVEPEPESVALLVRIAEETLADGNLTILAHAHPNGNMKSSSATLRLPLGFPAPAAAGHLAPQAAPSEPEPTGSAPTSGAALTTGAFAGGAAGLLALALRLKKGAW